MARAHAPRRVQMSSRRGPWRRDHPDVLAAPRPSRWGNPFPVARHGRAEAIGLCRGYLDAHPDHLCRADVVSDLVNPDR